SPPYQLYLEGGSTFWGRDLRGCRHLLCTREPERAMTAITWVEGGAERSAGWRPENGATPPRDIVVIDDDIAADSALRLARAGTGLLWRGDYHNARQLLRALDRRLEKQASRRASRKASRSSNTSNVSRGVET